MIINLLCSLLVAYGIDDNIYCPMGKNGNNNYCTFCGKQIAVDDIYCPHCGNKQMSIVDNTDERHKVTSSKLGVILKSKKGIKNNTNVNCLLRLKRIVMFILAICGIVIIVLFFLWVYGFYKTSQWEKEDKKLVELATKDISKSDSIAKILFGIYAKYSHNYYFSLLSCGNDHIRMGLEVLRNAAEKGEKNAQFRLGAIYGGVHYEYPQPCWKDESPTMFDEEIDYNRAAYWYTLAAEQGHSIALNNLGIAYKEGKGVKRNLVKATKYIKKAAEQGYSLAEKNYGDMFRDGDVCISVEDSITGNMNLYIKSKPNIKKAKEWWEKAAQHGNLQAKKNLEKVYE